MRFVAAFFLLAHGVAHLVGFAGSWRLSADIPYHTTLLAGRVDVGDGGMKVMGVLWVLAALLFAAVAAGLTLRADWWQPLLVATALASLVLSILELPSARIGVAIDVAILVGLAVAARLLPGIAAASR
ncbi:MAG TPA: hypothetical protein VEA99_13590 [Gemmatimonadaceae bacterium]|nr:hypothetical protein [Gemmatimonadaceae bacterium]